MWKGNVIVMPILTKHYHQWILPSPLPVLHWPVRMCNIKHKYEKFFTSNVGLDSFIIFISFIMLSLELQY